MSDARGHRAVEHTADEILEAWGPSRAACLEEAVLGFVALFATADPDSVDRRHAISLDGHDDRLALLDLLDEVLFLAETEDAVPATTCHLAPGPADHDRGHRRQLSPTGLPRAAETDRPSSKTVLLWPPVTVANSREMVLSWPTTIPPEEVTVWSTP